MKQYEDYLKLLGGRPLGRRSWRTAHWLCEREDNFESILEIGRHMGHSLGLFKYLWPDSRIVSIDIVPRKEALAVIDLFDARDSIELIDGDVSKLDSSEIFDLVLIDGDHTHSGARADWEGIQQNISKGSIVVFDDLDHPLGCGKAFYEIEGYKTEQTETMGVVYI